MLLVPCSQVKLLVLHGCWQLWPIWTLMDPTMHVIMLQAFVKMDGSFFSKVMRAAAPLLAQSAETGAYSMLYTATAPELKGEACRLPQCAMHPLLASSHCLREVLGICCPGTKVWGSDLVD